MEPLTLPRGLILNLITPFDREGRIDGRGLGRLLDRTLPYVQGVFIASPFIGEGRYMDPGLREELLAKVLVVVRSKVPVLAWITQAEEKGTLETLRGFEKQLVSRRYDGHVYWVDAPLYYHSNRGLPDHYRELVSHAKRPFILLNDPALPQELGKPLKRNNIRTAILKELGNIPEIKGLIFLGSLDRANNYQRAVKGRTDFRFYDGDEVRFLSYPSRSGIISAGANLAPRAWRRITFSSLNLIESDRTYPDQLGQIWEMGDYLRSLLDLYEDRPVPMIKRILRDMGIIETAAGTPPGEQDLGDAPGKLRELMERFGDYA
ncbi:MAG: dihydrodipicolinate synthase family protein [Deltaproteobacteria bacterium]|nr:dihydrodipicolinate synthase family protein [Deltaproteobacteria bacterium]